MYSRLIYNRIDNKYTISRKLRGLFTNTYNKLHVCQPILGFSFAIFERFYVAWERGKVPRDILVGLRKIALSFCSYDQDTNFMQFPRVFILSTGWLCPRPCQRERGEVPRDILAGVDDRLIFFVVTTKIQMTRPSNRFVTHYFRRTISWSIS